MSAGLIALANTPPPLVLDVDQVRWPDGGYDAVYTANTLHIMAWTQVQTLFRRLPDMFNRRLTVPPTRHVCAPRDVPTRPDRTA